jgi:hypothetical protein
VSAAQSAELFTYNFATGLPASVTYAPASFFVTSDSVHAPSSCHITVNVPALLAAANDDELVADVVAGIALEADASAVVADTAGVAAEFVDDI